MTFSSLARRSIASPNQSSRGGRKIDHIVLHHMATTNGAYVEDLMRTGAKQVSSNYIQRNSGELVGVVPEELRSWSLSSTEWDGRSITVETENQSTVGWTISAPATESLARLVADVCRRYGIPCNRDRVLGHREVYTRHGASYATACPGGMNLDAIVNRAAQILAQGGIVTPTETEIETEEEEDMKNVGLYWKNKAGTDIFALVNTGSGFWSEWSGVGGAYNNPLSVGFGTGTFVGVSEAHAANLRSSAAAVRAGN